MNTPFKYHLFTIGMMAALLLSSYVFAYVWATTRAKPAVYQAGSAYFTDLYGTRVTKVRAGESFVFHAVAERQPLECWSLYTSRLDDGLKTYYFPDRRSTILEDDVLIHRVHAMMTVPKDVPAGSYEFIQAAFPNCMGVDLKPYLMETGDLMLEVLPPEK